jgi:ATP-dependent protease ClpP protease subunit
LIVPHSNYRLDPARSIQIQGLIDDQLVTRVTSQILRLQHEARTPITVYIDSPGGSVSSMETIFRLLKLSDQNNSGSCRIITAVTIRAASAAADLLASGDYAIAFPSSTVLYHGLRTFEKNPLTVESTSVLTHILRLTNDVYAMELARKIEDRFLFRFTILRGEFDGIRTKRAAPWMTDLDCFFEAVASKLSKNAKKAWDKAKDRYGRYQSLLDSVIAKSKVSAGPQRLAEMEARQIKAIVDFEVKTNKKNPSWTFKDGGMGRLADDFFLLNEYLESYSSERLKNWCKSLGRWSIPKADVDEIDAIADEKDRTERLVTKVRPILQPVWSFFVALCHALQEGENDLTATDAYWFGLVDEVIGEGFWSLRYIEEYKPDPPVKKTEPNEETKNTSEEQTSAAGA